MPRSKTTNKEKHSTFELSPQFSKNLYLHLTNVVHVNIYGKSLSIQ